MRAMQNSAVRKALMAGVAALSMGAAVAATMDTAQARGFGGGGAMFHGGGFHGGFGGGRVAGFRGGYGGFRGGRLGYGVGAAALGLGLGYGLASTYENACGYGQPYGTYGAACGNNAYAPYGY